MWQIESNKENGEDSAIYHLLVDEKMTVGRKGCNILIAGDPSVSRNHATFQTTHPISNIEKMTLKPSCTLKDALSKYGTFINGNQISENESVLNHGDIITFGQCGSNFKVSYTPLVVTSSCMDPDEKKLLKELVRKLGGHVIVEWNTECTHLVMTKIKVTVKTVCALLSKKPIVSMGYFRMLQEYCNTKQKFKDAKLYLPPVDEVSLNDKGVNFGECLERQELFKGMTFIFLSAPQYKKLHLPVTFGGGRPVLIHRSRCDVTPELLLSSCVIQYLPEGKGLSTQSQNQVCSSKERETIQELLYTHKKRFIPESDIGLAVVHCSVEQYCNPDFECDTQSTSVASQNVRLQSQTLSQNLVYVPETQQQTQRTSNISLDFSTIKTDTDTTSMSRNKEIFKTPIAIGSNDENQKKRFATNSSIEEPASKAAKRNSTSDIGQSEELDFSKYATKGSETVDFEAETQPTEESVMFRHPNDILPSTEKGKKRLLNSNDVETPESSKREKLDLQSSTASLFTEIKTEIPSPEFHITPEDDEQEERCVQEPLNTLNSPIVSQVFIKRDRQVTCLAGTSKDKTAVCKPSAADTKTNWSSTKSNHLKTQNQALTKTEALSNTTKHHHSGFVHSKNEQKGSRILQEMPVSNEEEVPSNLVIVKLADLVIEPRRLFNPKKNVTESVKNFKKFKKSSYVGANSLPRIIGGGDLIVHTSKENLNELNEWMRDQDTENTQPNVSNHSTGNTSFRAFLKKNIMLL